MQQRARARARTHARARVCLCLYCGHTVATAAEFRQLLFVQLGLKRCLLTVKLSVERIAKRFEQRGLEAALKKTTRSLCCKVVDPKA